MGRFIASPFLYDYDSCYNCMNSLRMQTPFEKMQASIDAFIPALRFYKQHKDRVYRYGLRAVFGDNRTKRRLFNKGKRLYAMGFTTCM